MEKAAEFRAEAAKCRALAKGTRDPVIARNLVELADEYDEEARRLDGQPDAQPPMPTAD